VDLISLIEKNNNVSQAQCVYRCFDVKELLAWAWPSESKMIDMTPAAAAAAAAAAA